MIVRTWRRGDTEAVELQSAQQYLRCIVDVRADFTELAEKGLVWTAEHDGAIIGCAALYPFPNAAAGELACLAVHPQWENRATAFALLSDDSGTHFPAIHSAVVEFLDNASYRRIEATVDVGFKQGHRWIKMLGFELEGYMKAYRPDGADMLLYARVK